MAQLRVVAPMHLHVNWVEVAPVAPAQLLVGEGRLLAPPAPAMQLQLRFGHEPQYRRPTRSVGAPRRAHGPSSPT